MSHFVPPYAIYFCILRRKLQAGSQEMGFSLRQVTLSENEAVSLEASSFFIISRPVFRLEDHPTRPVEYLRRFNRTRPG